jgi:hypothetical protein
MNGVFAVLTLVSVIVCAVGFLSMMLCAAFDAWAEEWPDKAAALGMVGAIVFGVGFWLTSPPSLMSRGIVGDKRERRYTTFIMAGKVMVPQQHVAYELVSTEGAICDTPAESYVRYRAGDAVVCAWSR